MMTEEEYAERTEAQIAAAFSHRSIPTYVGASAEAKWFLGKAADDLTAQDWAGRETALHDFGVEAFLYYLQSALVVAITTQGFPPLTQVLLHKLTKTHDQHFQHLDRLTPYEVITIRHCLHLLSYRPEIGDGPVRVAMRTVVAIRPVVH